MQNLLRFLKSRYFLTTLVMLVVVALVLLVGSLLNCRPCTSCWR